MPLYSPNNRYRLILSDDGLGDAPTLEFEAVTAEAALHHAQHHCAGREVELFENGRSLGRMKCVAGGYWTLSARPPRRSRPVASSPG